MMIFLRWWCSSSGYCTYLQTHFESLVKTALTAIRRIGVKIEDKGIYLKE